jgi:hypothetical protein
MAETPVDRLVDFLICGTQKGGTTALDSHLRDHPAICMAQQKEVHFFDRELWPAATKPDYSHYHSYFCPGPAHRRIGEATPIYMYWQDAPKRIWQYNPSMKIIVLLRNPIARAYSHWNMERSRDAETLGFWEALQQESQRCRAALPHQHRVYSYIDRGYYMEQLRRLWHYFSRANVLILNSDSLRQHPSTTLEEVCTFLGLEPLASVAPRAVNPRPYATAMGSREKDYLRQIFEPEIRSLERELGWDCRSWLTD